MNMVEILQWIMWTSMEVMVCDQEYGTGKHSGVQCSHEHDSGKSLFKTRKNYLVTYESAPLKQQVDYCLVRNDKKVVSEIMTSKERSFSHKSRA